MTQNDKMTQMTQLPRGPEIPKNPNVARAGGKHDVDNGRQTGTLERLRGAAGWVVDYECDSVDEAWLLSPEGGSGR